MCFHQRYTSYNLSSQNLADPQANLCDVAILDCTEDYLSRRLGPSRKENLTHQAADLLIAKGFRIVARRFKSPVGEIDIVARRRSLLIFVEVKARPDLEEAALVDGTTRMGALWRIVLPLTAPGVFTTAILSFITVWNDFLFGLTMTADSNAQTVTVAIPLFNGEHQIAFGEVSAAAIIVTIPLVIMVLFLQRRIVSGLTAGAVKG